MSAVGDARVTAVRVSGKSGAYAFEVTIASNDRGPHHYADWWEVVSADGTLLYRRILLHDHADEQPFTRDGGPVPVDGMTPVTVRAHVHPSGYAREAVRGMVDGGFAPIELAPDFAPSLASEPPLPRRR
ncbi:MAG: hypothetical protein ABI346_00125 [Candidatus Baltobacteraceae bacterium]